METRHTTADATKLGAAPLPLKGQRAAVRVLGAFAFAALTLVGANIHIPLHPVPITLQTLFVLLAGAVLGGGYGSLGQAIYLGVGVFGLPVFAGKIGGVGVLVGPTGGYLAGFLVVPLLVGWLISKRDSIWWHFFVFGAGSMVILLLGVVQLTLVYTHDLWQSFAVGFLPFIPGDLLKIAAAGSIYRSFTAVVRHRRRNS